jgi:cytochrome P450
MIERNLSTQGLSLQEFTGYSRDIFMGSGDYWKAARKSFVKGILKNLARSEPIIEKRIKEAIISIKKESDNGNPVRVGEIFSFQTFGVIADMSVGRIPMKDEAVRELLLIFKKMNPYQDLTSPRNLIPGYRYLPWDDEFRKLLKRRDAILENVIQEHKKTLDRGNPVDFLDTLLADSESGELESISILHVLMDTFVGGTDSSSNTMEFMIAYMANHPEIQKKVHDELDFVVKGRTPNLDDESKLPYLNAVLKEVMRIISIAGALCRETMEDINFKDYLLPKGTVILILIHTMANDPQTWKDPHVFRPERFLEEEQEVAIRGGEMPKNRDFLKMTPFGIGKRACAGYQLARKELFYQAAYYMWAFEFSLKDPQSKIEFVLETGLATRSKYPVEVKARFRHSENFKF